VTETPLEVMASQVFGDESTEEKILCEDSQEWLETFRREHPIQSVKYEMKLGSGLIESIRTVIKRR